jgi:protein TonB
MVVKYYNMKAIKVVIIILLLSTKLFGQETQNISDEVCRKPDVAAEYPGGQGAFANFIGSELHYPKDAAKAKVGGHVYVEFIVGKDGAIEQKNIIVLRGVSNSIDEEAMRVISISPKWSPALKDGKPVRTRFVMPINFNISKIKF